MNSRAFIARHTKYTLIPVEVKLLMSSGDLVEDFKVKPRGACHVPGGSDTLFLMKVYNEVEGRTEGGRKNEDNWEYFLHASLTFQNFFSCE